MIEVDDQGYIVLKGDRLSPREAIDLAWGLTDAVRRSRDRNQIGTPHYNDSARILARMRSPLGKALTALEKAL